MAHGHRFLPCIWMVRLGFTGYVDATGAFLCSLVLRPHPVTLVHPPVPGCNYRGLILRSTTLSVVTAYSPGCWSGRTLGSMNLVRHQQ
jgi:hypothetical protein